MSPARRPPGADRWRPWPQPAPRLPGSGPWRKAGKRPFGQTWWGAAWVQALEQRARLDPNRLPRGRTYARTGAVGDLEVAPGEVRARVQGSRFEPYEVRVRVRAFSRQEWATVLDALAAEIGHAAALLDGELPPGVADDVRSVGLDLLPGAGEVLPRCSCPDWADPCKHSAAACYLVADALDEDPFVLLLLRGRERTEVLAGVRARRAGSGTTGLREREPEPEVDRGVVARDAWRREGRELPSAPLPPRRAGRPTVLGSDPPAESGLDAAALRGLASDAAQRAWELALGEEAPREALVPAGWGSTVTAEKDLARRVAARLGAPDGSAPGRPAPADDPGSDVLAKVAERAGLPVRELLRRGIVWRDGGPEGLSVLLDSWDPPAAAVADARGLLDGRVTVRRNRLTRGDRQLRLGRDGRVYPFRRARDGSWEPDGPPVAPPASI